MAKPFDATFFGGGVLVVLSVAIAWLALTNPALPIIGSGRGALITIAIVGMAGCAVAGISQAPELGWTHPVVIVGSVLGVASLLVIAAGLFGWEPVLRPVASLTPGDLAVGASTERLAIIGLTALIVIKWVIGIGLAASRAVFHA